MRAPDGWESARFQAVCMAGGWFRQNGVLSSHPPAGNAPRWAVCSIHILAQEKESSHGNEWNGKTSHNSTRKRQNGGDIWKDAIIAIK